MYNELFAVRYATNQGRKRVENFIHHSSADRASEPMPLDFFFWVAVNQDRVVLIDSGADKATCESRGHTLTRPVEDGLRILGYEPEQVSDIVTTHLHWDHAGNIGLFANATLHVQAADLAYVSSGAMAEPFLRRPFERSQVIDYVAALHSDRVNVVEGDRQPLPGIHVHHVGGHTPGMQFVRILTTEGWRLLASDALHYWANLTERNPFPVLVDAPRYVAAQRQMLSLVDDTRAIVPGHDPTVLTSYPRAHDRTDDVVSLLTLPEDAKEQS